VSFEPTLEGFSAFGEALTFSGNIVPMFYGPYCKRLYPRVCPCKLNGKTVSACPGSLMSCFHEKFTFFTLLGRVFMNKRSMSWFFRLASRVSIGPALHTFHYSPLLFLPCHQPSSQQESRLCVLLKGRCPYEIQGSKYLIPAKKSKQK